MPKFSMGLSVFINFSKLLLSNQKKCLWTDEWLDGHHETYRDPNLHKWFHVV